jgi:hypothetical protein
LRIYRGPVESRREVRIPFAIFTLVM